MNVTDTIAKQDLCFEVLFDMSLLGKDAVGIQHLLHNSILKCSADDKKRVFQNVYVSGGISKVPGFSDRLKSHLQSMNPTIPEINVKTLDIGQIMMEGARKIIENGGCNWITKDPLASQKQH
ncbi:hypothetical protein GCK72_016542 [Caenorhabditis remanei]|uniref:Uncharacterized protein n=1 Tax=Caenorhabditis remanei TaxID=31234 RepID=A0A6A5G4X4_CAERE|nr:hypothetical protein GCK72_016542 [Caenorhabditis remanei]KAF1749997.1 hypothetical protein GCK72_016542 [Caenorhabditis remanei]